MSAVYRFERFEVRVAQRSLIADGRPIPIGARAFDVLLWLIEHRDRLVTKQELLEAVWPGLVVEENNLSVQVSTLRKVLGAGAIVTVAGRGYRFAAEVSDAMRQHPQVALDEVPDRPAIAVLPFGLASADPADALLADGLVADVIALLARVPGFLLISRASTFVFRDERHSLPDLAQQLAARYVVEGTVRTRGDDVHVSTQLIDAQSARILWSGAFQSTREEAEDLQGGIARGIISQLQPQLTRAEIALIRRQRPDNLDAWGHYHQAVDALASRGWGEEGLAQARAHLQGAMRADPQFGLARAYYAVLTVLGRDTAVVADWPSLKTEMLRFIDEAVRLDGSSPEVLGYAGCALCELGHLDHGLDLLGQALEIDPSNAQARVARGAALALQGRADEGIAEMRLGMRISPRDRRLGFWTWVVARFLLRIDKAEEALAEARHSSVLDPRLYLAPLTEAGALVRLGRAAEAAEPMQRAQRMRPATSLSDVSLTLGPRVGSELTPLWPGESAGAGRLSGPA